MESNEERGIKQPPPSPDADEPLQPVRGIDEESDDEDTNQHLRQVRRLIARRGRDPRTQTPQ